MTDNKLQKNTFRYRKKQEGFVLLFAVTISSILLSVALGVANVAFREVKFSASGRDTNNAFLAADTGVECALANDKLSDGVFPIEGPATDISCAGNTITPVFTATADTGTYTFVVPNLGSSESSCARVTLVKDQGVDPTLVTITSNGYNIGDSSCNSTNPNRTERRLQVSSYVGDAPASVTGFLVDNAGTLATNLISYWKLDETTGNRIDSKGSNNLTVTNGVSYAGGKMGNSVAFTAVGGAEDRVSQQYLQINDNATISAGDTNFTFAGWVYMGRKDKNMSIVAKGDSGAANEFNLRYTLGSDRFEFWVHNGSALTSIFANNFGSPSINTWYYVVAWHDATNNQLGIQINNGTANTSSYSGAVQDNTSRFLVGTWQDTPDQEWEGRIDELGFWRKVLSAQEKADLYNNGAGNTYTSSGGGSNATLSYTGTSSGSHDLTTGPFSMSSAGSYTLTSNVTFSGLVKCWGGGGGGGATGQIPTYRGGGGGGGGGFVTVTSTFTAGIPYSMIVGAFGTRGTWTENNEGATYSGGNGGNSSFESYIAYGGSGGLKGASGGTGGAYGSFLNGAGYHGGTGGTGALWNGSAGSAGGGGGGAGTSGHGSDGGNGVTNTIYGGLGGAGGTPDGGAGGNGQYSATAAVIPGGGGGGGNPASGGAVHGIDGATGKCTITKL